MGAVWAAQHVTLGHSVAVKILHVFPKGETALRARFLREAALAANVRHPCVVRAIDFGDHEGLLWYAMEQLEGEPLEDLIAREAPMDPYVITALLAPLVSALTHLHGQGLVHRDLKPANLFLSRVEGAPAPVLRLLDFGIARKLDDDDVRLTEASAVMGSPAYMAPEQARGVRDVGPAADQYAFGIIVYEALTGQLPHQGDSLLAMLCARREAPPHRRRRPRRRSETRRRSWYRCRRRRPQRRRHRRRRSSPRRPRRRRSFLRGRRGPRPARSRPRSRASRRPPRRGTRRSGCPRCPPGASP